MYRGETSAAKIAPTFDQQRLTNKIDDNNHDHNNKNSTAIRRNKLRYRQHAEGLNPFPKKKQLQKKKSSPTNFT